MKTVFLGPSYGVLYPFKKNDRFTFFLDIKFRVHTENGQEDIVEVIGVANQYLPDWTREVEFSQKEKQGILSAVFNHRFIESYINR
jgi:hypothetical protein